MIDVPVRVKDALREGCYRKNYKIVVFESDEETIDFTIDNNDLITESVKIDERMCSADNIKFGLCEGTRVDFECYGIENITGRRLKLYVEVEYKDEQGEMLWHPITLGWFDVKSCSKNPDTNKIKISCYNKLLSEYLNNKVNDGIVEAVEEGDTGVQSVSMATILDRLLDGYAIEPDYKVLNFGTEDYDSSNPSGPNDYGIIVVKRDDNYYTLEGSIVTSSSQKADFENEETTAWVGNLQMRFIDYDADERAYINSPDNHCRFSINAKVVYDSVIDRIERQTNENIDDIYVWTGGSTFTKATDYFFRNPTISHNAWNEAYYRYSDNSTSTYTYIEIYLNKDQSKANSDYFTSPPYISGGVYPRVVVPNLFVSYSRNWYNARYDYSEWLRIMAEEWDKTAEELMDYSLEHIGNSIFSFQLEERIDDAIATREFTTEQAQALPDVTLRDLQSAVFETECQFGRLDRETDLFYGMELNNARLYPAEDLYPANDLYPISLAERVNRAMYEKLWCDEGQIKNFRNLIITYKGTEEQSGQTVEVDKIITKVVNADGTDDYICDDNWLFRNLVWTDSDMEDYADAMVTKMQNLTWFPFELWCAGLPYIETGDELEINIGQHAYTSYVLRRNLNGIQDLHDEMECGELEVF